MGRNKMVLLLSPATLLNALKDGMWITRKTCRKSYKKGTIAKVMLNSMNVCDRETLTRVEVIETIEEDGQIKLFCKSVDVEDED